MTFLPFFGRFVLPNRRQVLQAGERVAKVCQDHAVLLHDHKADVMVLAVADGVSTVRTLGGIEHSHAQAGGVLVAELAAAAAFAACSTSCSPDQIEVVVREALRDALAPLQRILGPRTSLVLSSTLLLAVVVDEWTAIWACGDGSWGVTPRPDVRCSFLRPPEAMPQSDGTCFYGADLGQAGEPLRSCVLTLVRGRDSDLERVALVAGGIEHIFLASDGLGGEPALREALRRPASRRADLLRLTTRPSGCDDLAIAYASGIGGAA